MTAPSTPEYTEQKLPFVKDKDPEIRVRHLVIDQRVRFYMAITSFWYVFSALSIWYGRSVYSAGVEPFFVEEIFSLRGWAIIMFVTGVIALGGIIHPREIPIRVFLVVSVAVKLVFALSLLFADNWTPGMVSYLALAFMDMLFASMSFTKRQEIITKR